MSGKTLYDYCMEQQKKHLLLQWSDKNIDISPKTVSYSSHKLAWWQCEQGHEWQTKVFVRTIGSSGCPFCAGKRMIPEQNSLATLYPDLLAEWDYDKNREIEPNTVMPGSHRKVWWRCAHGHEWQAIIKSRTGGTGCPICANRRVRSGENDLATRNPMLAEQWHPTKNGELTPQMVLPGSEKRVWWQCEQGHEWQAKISARTNTGSGCPICSGRQIVAGVNDLASVFPDLVASWHPTKNGTLTPQSVSPYSNRRVWWQCELAHEWRSTIAQRTAALTGCPYCAGVSVLPGFNDLATFEPLLAAQWHPTKNGTLTPQMVTRGSRKKVWWQCEIGHEWKAVVYSRTGTRRTGCPTCAGRKTVNQ